MLTWLTLLVLVLLALSPVTSSLSSPRLSSRLSSHHRSSPSPSPSPSSPIPSPHHVRLQHLSFDQHADLVIDSHTPRFHWRIPLATQSAYELVIHTSFSPPPSSPSSPSSPPSSTPLYTSGAIPSSRQSHHYSGPPFTSDTRYTFHLRYLPTSSPAPSNTSHPSSLPPSSTPRWSLWYVGHFRTGLFDPSDWAGVWIGHEALNMNQMRKVFTLPASSPTIQSATLFLCGLGYHQLDVNGQRVDPSRRLDPGWTTYQQRSLYVSFDLTSLLHPAAANAIGVTLGQGWYAQQPWQTGPGAVPDLSSQYGPVRVLAQLNIRLSSNATLSIATDATWMGREGEHRMDGVYPGSVVDMRAYRPTFSSPTFVDPYSLWINATVLPSPLLPTGLLTLQPMPPVRAGPDALHVRTSGGSLFPSSPHALPLAAVGLPVVGSGVIHPVHSDFSNGQLYDLQQNIAGWCSIANLTLTPTSSSRCATRNCATRRAPTACRTTASTQRTCRPWPQPTPSYWLAPAMRSWSRCSPITASATCW